MPNFNCHCGRSLFCTWYGAIQK